MINGLKSRSRISNERHIIQCGMPECTNVARPLYVWHPGQEEADALGVDRLQPLLICDECMLEVDMEIGEPQLVPPPLEQLEKAWDLPSREII